MVSDIFLVLWRKLPNHFLRDGFIGLERCQSLSSLRDAENLSVHLAKHGSKIGTDVLQIRTVGQGAGRELSLRAARRRQLVHRGACDSKVRALSSKIFGRIIRLGITPA
jgi:hypothetical protein